MDWTGRKEQGSRYTGFFVAAVLEMGLLTGKWTETRNCPHYTSSSTTHTHTLHVESFFFQSQRTTRMQTHTARSTSVLRKGPCFSLCKWRGSAFTPHKMFKIA